MLPAGSAGHPWNLIFYFWIVPMHPRLQGEAFPAPAGNNPKNSLTSKQSHYSLIISMFLYMRRRHVCIPVSGRQWNQQHGRGCELLYARVIQHSSPLTTSAVQYSQELLTCTGIGWPCLSEQVVSFPDPVRYNPGEWLPVLISSFVCRAVKFTVG